MSVEDYLLLMKTIPIKRRGVVREHKLYKIYLPKEFDDLWNYLNKEGRKVDIIVLIPEFDDRGKPGLLKLVDKIVMRNKYITRERNRFKIYLSSTYNDIWEYLNKHSIKVDVIVFIK